MKNFYFVIDSREAKLLEVFGEKHSDGLWTVKKQYQTYVKFGQLPAGDVCFYFEESPKPPRPVVLIERKEVRDLSSCIDSGSYREQKMRMLKFQEENPGLQLIYLVENFSVATKQDLDTIVNKSAPPKSRKTIKVLMSAIVSTMLRDNFFVMTTQGFDGTVAFIERIYDKWPDYRAELEKRNVLTQQQKTDISGSETTSQQPLVCAEYLKNVKVSKKENIDPPSWYVMSLAQIPGVSVDKATQIQKVYPNFNALLDKYKSLTSSKECEKMLKDIECGTRKLGPVVSKRVYEYVVCTSEPIVNENAFASESSIVNE